MGEYPVHLSTKIPEHELLCLHAEADTALFTIYSSIRAVGYLKHVVMDTEDTDNYIQATYVLNRVPGSILIK